MMMSKHGHKHDDDLGYLKDMVDAMKADEPPRAAFEDARHRLLQEIEATEKGTLMKTFMGTTLQARFGRAAVAAAMVLATAFFILKPLGTDPGSVYASVIQQLKDAVTVAFSAEWYFEGHAEPTHIEMAFREPGLQRTVMTYEGAEIIQVNDTVTNKGLILIPAGRMYVEMDLVAMPSAERERLGLLRMVTESLETLPPDADEVLKPEIIDGRSVLGFRAGQRTLWIDPASEALVRVDNTLGGTRMVMSNFRLDPEELDASMFSTTPPEGYTPTVGEAVAFDTSNPGEEDLVMFLDYMAAFRVDSRFPAMVNPMEVLTLEEKGLFREYPDTTPEQTEAAGQAFAQASQRAVTFVVGMKPVNDWHYAGDGVVRDSVDTPIAWWKPEGSATYRVIWADLSITDESNWDHRD